MQLLMRQIMGDLIRSKNDAELEILRGRLNQIQPNQIDSKITSTYDKSKCLPHELEVSYYL